MITMNTTLKAIMICVICAATLMSGCITGDKNADGFSDGEIREFDFIFEQNDTEMDMVGTIEWDGEHYIIDCEFETVIENFIFTGKSEGLSNNVRMTVYGPFNTAEVSYIDCEGTPVLKAMIENATQ